MKSTIRTLVLGILGLAAITSCQTSSNLSDSKVFQKRRYTKGYHVNFRKSPSNSTTKFVTEKAFEENDSLTKVQGSKITVASLNRQVKSSELITASRDDEQIVDNHSSATRQNTWKKNISWPSFVSEIFSSQPEEYVEQSAPAGAIIGFIASIVGLFVAGIPLGILAIILCSVAIGKIEKNPGMKGKGIAIAGIVIGVIAVVGALIVISSM